MIKKTKIIKEIMEHLYYKVKKMDKWTKEMNKKIDETIDKATIPFYKYCSTRLDEKEKAKNDIREILRELWNDAGEQTYDYFKQGGK